MQLKPWNQLIDSTYEIATLESGTAKGPFLMRL
jgi:hypothetical protein